MDPKISRLVDRVKAFLYERYGESIKRVILYGSYARGEQTRDSDVDVLVLVDQSVSPREVDDSLDDLLYDMLLNEGELVSVIVLTEDHFENRNLPFMVNVRKEGITI